MAPGPVQVSQAIRDELAHPMIHHRTPDFEIILKSCLKNLKVLFQTEQPVLMMPGTGSAGMEAAIVNCFSPGDEVLVIVSGKFGERWAEMAEAHGLIVHQLSVNWGSAVDIKTVENSLQQNRKIKGVFSQACETSTGTWHPIHKLAELTRENPDCLLLIDAITGLGCSNLPMDLWGLDVVVGGSQKAFGLPTGLCFVALSQKAWKFQKSSSCSKYYLDLAPERLANEKGQTRFSSAVSHIRGLHIFLKTIENDGLEKLIRRTKNLSQCTQSFAKRIGLELFSKEPSPSTTALVVPPQVDGIQWRSQMESQYKITLIGGQSQLKGKVIRMGHMGDISNLDLLVSLEVLGHSLRDLEYDLPIETLNVSLNEAEVFLNKCSNVSV